MKMIEAAGWIVTDAEGIAIYGAAKSGEDAWAQVVDQCSPFFNSFGEVISEAQAKDTKFLFFKATQELLDEVEHRGGAIAWSEVDDIACTEQEWLDDSQAKWEENHK